VRETTLALIKPDAVSQGLIGEVIRRLEAADFKIAALKVVHLSEEEAGAFYAVHREKAFYDDLVRFMTEGPIVAIALSRDRAVAHLRSVIGATDPAEAEKGTIRRDLAESKQRNVIHASDSPESATRELAFFFSERELLSR
jgi:nucleoside-diphosphate kinase